jgi:hypothetical protein
MLVLVDVHFSTIALDELVLMIALGLAKQFFVMADVAKLVEGFARCRVWALIGLAVDMDSTISCCVHMSILAMRARRVPPVTLSIQ